MTFLHMLGKLLLFLSLLSSSLSYDVHKYPLLMPDVHPEYDESYLCTPVRVNYTKNYYIIGFEPVASMHVVHHELLYGCLEPGASLPYWDCGEMSDSPSGGPSYPPCKNTSQIIWAWARDAPKLILPPEVGFKVGGDSPIQYLVLQVHYAHVDSFRNGRRDSSGVNLLYTETKMPKLAGVLLLGTGGRVPGMRVEHMETSCKIKENKEIHPFAFRTHTHSLGKVVSGFKVARDDSGRYEWTLLGKKDPMLPQMFYPIQNRNITIKKGDILAARCTMKSDRATVTYVGSRNSNEMCNFYLMYYGDSEPLNIKYCFTAGPPDYYWHSNGLSNIPEHEASSLD